MAAPPSRTVSRRWLASFANLAAGEALTSLMRLAAMAAVARRLGPAEFGLVSIAIAVGTYVALIAHSGLDIGGTRAVAEHPNRARDRLAAIVGLRLLLASVGYAIVVAALLLLPLAGSERWTIAGLTLVVFTQACDTRWAFIAVQQTRPAAATNALGALAFLTASLALVRNPASTNIFVAIYIAADAVGVVALWLVSRRRFGRWRPRLARSELLPLVRSSLPITLTRCSRTLFIVLDVVIVRIFCSKRDTGNYALAGRCVAVAIAYVGLYYHAYLPALSGVRNDPVMFGRLVAAARRRASIVGPAVVGAAVSVAPFAVVRLFGSDYRPMVGLFQIMVLSIGFLILTGVYSGVLLALDEAARLARIAVAAAALNIGTNLVLVPRVGAVGASWATVVAEAATFMLTAASARKVLVERLQPGHIEQDTGGLLRAVFE